MARSIAAPFRSAIETRRARPGRSEREGCTRRSAIASTPGPLRRTTAIAPRPAGVASAAIVSPLVRPLRPSERELLRRGAPAGDPSRGEPCAYVRCAGAPRSIPRDSRAIRSPSSGRPSLGVASCVSPMHRARPRDTCGPVATRDRTTMRSRLHARQPSATKTSVQATARRSRRLRCEGSTVPSTRRRAHPKVSQPRARRSQAALRRRTMPIAACAGRSHETHVG